jgi:hypothetical protein
MSVGTQIAGYRLEELVGKGGMGVVYRAHDVALERSVALKLLSPTLAEDADFRERFLVESRLAASLDHPNVVPIYDAGEVEGQLYLAMRYVEGSDLKELLTTEGALEPSRAIAICSQIGDALDAAHARGLVHRDVKPSNVLLDEREHAYLADFGLTRRLSDEAPGFESGLSLGTPAYVAPEQIEGAEVDGRADQYSLACLLHECLTGEPPFPRSSEAAALFAHLEEAPPAPAGLEDVIPRAMAKDPADRYQSCRAFIADAHGAILAPRRRGRRRWLAAALVVAAAMAASIGIVLNRDTNSARDGPPAITQTSIAGARLGLRRGDYEEILGRAVPVVQPAKTPGAPSSEYPTLTFNESKLWVFFPGGFDATGEIIVTWNKEFRTGAGIGPCSTIGDLKAAYGEKVRPDYFGTIGDKHFMYDLGRNLLFPVSGELSPPGEIPVPGKYVAAVGLFNGSAPGADEFFGERPFAGFVTGNQTPQCVP